MKVKKLWWYLGFGSITISSVAFAVACTQQVQQKPKPKQNDNDIFNQHVLPQITLADVAQDTKKYTKDDLQKALTNFLAVIAPGFIVSDASKNTNNLNNKEALDKLNTFVKDIMNLIPTGGDYSTLTKVMHFYTKALLTPGSKHVIPQNIVSVLFQIYAGIQSLQAQAAALQRHK
ncbi:hypothetical protein ACXYRK_02990 [Mycoplasma sp. AC1221]